MNNISEENSSVKMWFVCGACTGSKIHGPLTTSEVELELLASPTTTVWWKGIEHWMSGSEWLQMRDSALQNRSKHYFFDHERHIPRSLQETLDLIVPSKKIIQRIKLWSPVDNRSKSVFEVKPICDALGLKMRKFVRTPLSGVAVIKSGTMSFITELESVSAEGMGVKVSSGVELPKGEVTVTFERTEINQLAPVTAKLLYSHGGLAGFKFERINSESSHRIISHVKEREGAAIVEAA
jgi:hypothetical protein